MTSITIKRKPVEVKAEAATPLLWVLRGELQLTGTKYGCGLALCGACTVHVDGVATPSCVTPISALGARDVTTIEGLTGPHVAALMAAWAHLDVAQCGYRQSGQLKAGAALLKQTPRPTDAEIDTAMAGNICRCGTYPRIRAAVRQAAAMHVVAAVKD